MVREDMDMGNIRDFILIDREGGITGFGPMFEEIKAQAERNGKLRKRRETRLKKFPFLVRRFTNLILSYRKYARRMEAKERKAQRDRLKN